jgi:glycolate oxidase FAD binding subunit
MADVLTPGSEEQLSEIIRTATAPMRVEGGGTRPIGVSPADTVLSTRGMTGITLYEPGALTLVARSGTPLAEIETALAAENQRLAFEPMDHRALLRTGGAPTIGGVVAANVSGPRRVSVGSARDFALGVRLVDGAGNVVKNGGRVMKNVTGYDLVKLMCGAYGTLGVLTEVSLKVLPRPDTAATIRFRNLNTADAVALMSAALGSPFEVTGAAHLPETGETLLRIEGFEESVTYRAGRLRDALARFGAGETDASGDEWQMIGNVTALSDAEGDVWRISVKPSDAPRVAARLPEARLIFDWGGGLVWAGVPSGTDLRAKLHGIPGHATLIRADADTKRRLGVFHPEPPALADLARGLRARFDPRGLLNPGLMDAPATEPA